MVLAVLMVELMKSLFVVLCENDEKSKRSREK